MSSDAEHTLERDLEREKAIERMILAEPAAARVTSALIDEMLLGFPLSQLKDSEWFAEQFRPLVWVVVRQRVRMGNAEKRDEAAALAGRLRELWEDIRRFRHHSSDDQHELIRDLERNKARFTEARLISSYYGDETLVWLAKFFEELAMRLDANRQPPKWRAKWKRDWRVKIALTLMPVFEMGFGRKATLDKWPTADGNKTLGNWAEFFQRFMAAMLSEHATPDLEGILREAREKFGASGYSPGNFIDQ